MIIGLSGSRKSGTPSKEVESFAISSNGETGGSLVKNVVVNRCKNDHPDDYVSGIFVGSGEFVKNKAMSRVEKCNVDLGQYGQFAYSCNHHTIFEECVGRASRGLYDDWLDCTARLENCTLIGFYAAISMVGMPTRRSHRNVLAYGCKFTGERLVEWNQIGAPLIGVVAVTDSTFGGDYATAIKGVGGRIILCGVKYNSSVKHHLEPASMPPIVFGEGYEAEGF